MNSLWLDIEEYAKDKYEVGFLIISNKINKMYGYELILDNILLLDPIIEQNKISEIYVFNDNDAKYLKDLKALNNSELKVINISKIYQQTINESELKFKLQISKNSDIAKAFNIDINHNLLHHPLYDIQLTYCSYFNYLNIYDSQTKIDKLYDSFFVLSGKLDIYWSLLKTWSINMDKIEVTNVICNEFNNRYFYDGSLIDKYQISFINYETLDKITFDLKIETIDEILSFFKDNVIFFLKSTDQKDLSKRIWNIMYYANNKQKQASFPLYVFYGINLSRFKNKFDDYSIENIKLSLNNELSLSQIERINKL